MRTVIRLFKQLFVKWLDLSYLIKRSFSLLFFSLSYLNFFSTYSFSIHLFVPSPPLSISLILTTFLFFLFPFLSTVLHISTYLSIYIFTDKEVHCTFRCVVVFSGWTCLVANSVKRWKAALTSSVIGKTLTRYSGLLWQCFRYLQRILFHVSLSRAFFPL